MRKNRKKIISLLLAICMIATLVPAICISAFAEDPAQTVKIVGFSDKSEKDLRASQLLEAQATGFATDATLEYTWTTLGSNGSWLLVYSDSNMAEAAYSDKGKYAAIAGSDATADSVKVVVKDTNANSSTYNKTAEYTYTGANNVGFLEADLTKDIGTRYYGLIKDDTLGVRTILGQGGVTHITCGNSNVDSCTIPTYGTAVATVAADSKEFFKITAVGPGKTTATVQVTKQSGCTFHPGKTGSNTINIIVYDMPDYVIGTDSVTINKTDVNVTYTLGGKSIDGTGKAITFDGLTKGETYQLVLSRKGETTDPGNAYISIQVGAPISISGIINDDAKKPVEKATVKLVNGTKEIAKTVTASDGSFTFNDIPVGTYNVVIDNNGVITTKIVTVRKTADLGTVVISTKNVNSVVEVKEKAPQTVVGDLDKVYDKTVDDNTKGITKDDLAKIEAGGKSEVKVVVEAKDEKTAENASDIQKIMDNDKLKVGMFVDLSVLKTITDKAGSSTTTKLIELPELVTLYIDLDEKLQGMATYVIYRYHGGNIDTITATPNDDGECVVPSADGKQLILKIKKFSTYALGYSENVVAVKNASTPVTVPEEKVADTADTNMLAAYVALACVSVVSVAAVTAKKKHEN